MKGKTMQISEPKGIGKKPKATATKAGGGKTKGAKGKSGEDGKKKVLFRDKIKPLFQRPRKARVFGKTVPPKRDMTHFVKWPRYIKLQRQRKILLSRLKTPPALHLFDTALDRATATSLMAFLHKMRPEEKKARKARRLAAAKAVAEALKGKTRPTKETLPAYKAALRTAGMQRPVTLHHGLNKVTNLIMRGKAKLVVIAHDVAPIELVVWLPALCRKKKVPFCIIKGKARLGKLCHLKTTACVAIEAVPKDLQANFATLVDAIRPQYLENTSLLRKWGEPVMGRKHIHREQKRARRVAKIEAAKEK